MTCFESIGLLMTYRCNLNCKYCYVINKQKKDMTLEMAQSILEPFLRKEEKLMVSFMGGETLLAMNVIRPLVEWVEQEEWMCNVKFFGSTNGTLLDEDLKHWLCEHRHVITLGLSYDGLPYTQCHNRGNNNIDLDFFISTWKQQPIQMTITAESVNKMAVGVIYLLERGAVVHPNVAFEETEWTNEKIKEYEKQLNILIYYYQRHPEKPLIRQFIHNLNDYADSIDNHKKQNQVCGAGKGFQVFDIDGRSYPCHILSPLVLTGLRLETIQNGLIEKTTDFSDSDCDNCPFTSSCPTCIACNYIYHNTLQKRDKTHCKLMQVEVKAFMKKEVLRLKSINVFTSDDAIEIDSIRKIRNYQKNIYV